jgi:hypothetical protein
MVDALLRPDAPGVIPFPPARTRAAGRTASAPAPRRPSDDSALAAGILAELSMEGCESGSRSVHQMHNRPRLSANFPAFCGV